MTRGRKVAAVDNGPVEGPWDLPEGWRWETLAAVSQVIAGQSPPSSTYNDEAQGLPFFQGKAEFGANYPTVRKWCSAPTKIADVGDVLISVRAPVGPTNFADTRCGIGRGLAAIRPDKAVTNGAWLRYWLQRTEHQLAEQGTGTTFAAITGDVLRAHPCPVPPLAIQIALVRKIDTLFAEIDEGVAALTEAQTGVETYRKSLLKAAVTGELTANWRRDNPPQESGEQLLQSILADRRARWEADPKNARKKYVEPTAPDIDCLPELPDGWTWATVQQLSMLVTSGSRGWSEYYADEGSLFIRAANLNRDRLDLSEIAFVRVPNNSEGARTRVKQGDFLITITGANVTKCGVVEQELEDAYVSQHVGLVRPVHNEIGKYLYLWSRAYGGGKQYLEDAAYGAGKPGLNLPNIYEMVVALPPFAEIAEIQVLAQQAQDRVPKEDFIGDLGRQLRQSILAAAFRGELTA